MPGPPKDLSFKESGLIANYSLQNSSQRRDRWGLLWGISLNVAKFSSSAVLYKENRADVLFYMFSIQRGRPCRLVPLDQGGHN